MKTTVVLDYLDSRLGSHTGSGPEYQYFCPACVDRLGDESSKRKLNVNIIRQVGHCWRCGFVFSSFRNLFWYINDGVLLGKELYLLADVAPAASAVVSTVRNHLDPPTIIPPVLSRITLPAENLPLTKYFDDPRCRRARTYLIERRGADFTHVRRFNIGYCPTGEYAHRLVFPIYQYGKQVYFTTRYCGNDPLKSKNPPRTEGAYSRRDCLLNFDGVVGEPVVALVEGPFDCMAFPHAVAILGKMPLPRIIADEQIKRIEELVRLGLREIVVALDADAAAERDGLVRRLRAHVPKVTAVIFEHGDPWDCRKDITKLLAQRHRPTVVDRVRGRLLTEK